jgi:sulfite exporter TauE/SafE
VIQTGFWIPLFLSGLLGSVGHCLGMCGPLNLMVVAQIRKNYLPACRSYLLYHMARVMVYALLGAIAGGVGSLLGLGQHLTVIGGAVSLLLGLAIAWLGGSYLGWLAVFPHEGAAHWWNEAFSYALRRGGSWGAALLGAVNGLLPCGLVYGALLLSASAGKAWSGALGMLIFGAGTLPALITLDLGAGALSVQLRQRMMKVAGALMLLVGLQLALRGGAALRLWPHLHWGKVVLW